MLGSAVLSPPLILKPHDCCHHRVPRWGQGPEVGSARCVHLTEEEPGPGGGSCCPGGPVLPPRKLRTHHMSLVLQGLLSGLRVTRKGATPTERPASPGGAVRALWLLLEAVLLADPRAVVSVPY